jgi:hypothetical protein
MGVIKDSTGDFVLGFVFLVAFAWLCAGIATGLTRPRRGPVEDGARAGTGTPVGR